MILKTKHKEVLKSLEGGDKFAKQVSEQTKIAKSDLSNLLTQLVGWDFVTSEPYIDDRRFTNLSLTEKGKEALKESK